GVAERSQLRQTEQKIREQAEFLNKATDAIIVCDTEHRIIYWNQSASRIYGWDDTDAEGEDLVELLFQNQPLVPVHEMFQAVETRDEWIGELPQRTREGRPISVQCRATLIRDENGLPKSLLLINTDITERKQLEEQFLRSQRLESLGALISGIAHDLNNALAPILIGADLLRKTPGKESILQTIESSARRGADMVQQVLAFTRGADSRKISVQLESLVKEMGKIIGDTFPKNISPEIKIEKGVWPVQGVPTQLYQVLMNLCVNARDAMPDGGSLTIEARNVQLDAATAADYPDAKAGDYVSVSVADTGTGISPDQMGKIFHPFFTTKGPGKGTGLGLSTSINIVKNHGGFMVVHSEVGKGTEFRFHLPATRIGQPGTGANPAPLPIGNGEGVLVIDNEAIVLVIARTALENYGYRVMTATNGMEAITCLNEKRDAANIAIIDLNLPHMSSASTIRALRKINPELRIIAAGESEPNGKPLPARVEGFIKKPFTVEKLLRNIHSVLTSK
ncbi:MAG TPA: ATP-binding protein, partial [Desulfuromonadaceae bacterium]|nr:ATP-binding protein [Desulfuromonadaceae bacterium]